MRPIPAKPQPLAILHPGMSPVERLQALRKSVAGRVIFTTSFGLEDQAITALIATAGIDAEFATLDTGRLFPQTYDLWAETEARYGVRITAFAPQADGIERFVAQQGINGFYKSVGARKTCCSVRKVEPLRRALAGAAGWITGLRADQSDHRQGLSPVSFDEVFGLVKLNPLFDWTREDVLAFVKRENVPVNLLHSKGMPSIGCAPCTRAVAPGKPERAGRWWWEAETETTKECGLHVNADGRLMRGVFAS